MLFNSATFLYLFLPVTVTLFYAFAAWGQRTLAIVWLIAASLFFYGWWNPKYLSLLVVSILVNYALGVALGRGSFRPAQRKWILATGVALNLAAIGYFKYAHFAVENMALLGMDWSIDRILLPLAISFYTFQQIAYLVDAYRGETARYGFLRYALFVVFFPQLIAGPIVHHSEVLPQLQRSRIFRFAADRLSIGLAIFFIGLFKKTVIADGVATYATPVFDAAEAGATLTILEAWGGALAYTFQLYFDFSGYSDMAVGLARLFGIRLPMNFYSPYKATSIIDFWRRWHITLSRFLKIYLYIPLGGNRKGPVRRYANLMITMLLGGLWHGAGWTFVIWGGLHGLYLVINHFWQGLRRRHRPAQAKPSWWGSAAARLTTFLAVVVAWVFFRAESFDGAVAVLRGMVGANGLVAPRSYADILGPAAPVLSALGWRFDVERLPYFYGNFEVLCLGALLMAVWFMPNTYQIMARYQPALLVEEFQREQRTSGRFWPIRLQWRLSPNWAVASAAVAVGAIFGMSQVSEFLYFQF